MQLIVLAGQARVGKTTLAKIIADKAFSFGMKPRLLSFAGPLKKLAKEKGYSKEENSIEYREFCQVYGAMKREEDQDHWVNEFEKELQIIVSEEQQDIRSKQKYWERCVIVDDCRYINEVGLGMKYKATLLFVSFGARDIPEKEEEWRSHHSEEMSQTIDKGNAEYQEMFTHMILNDKTIKDLKKKVDPMIPLWCGIQTPKTGECTCETCTARREGRAPKVEKCIADLLDILFLGHLEDEDDDDEKDTTN